jgi:thiamine-phosphate pyrophosphorylase
MKLPKIYGIINLEDLSETVMFAEYLLASGITILQLRDKSEDFHERLSSVGKHILEIRDRCYPTAKILINDYVKICSDIGADGVHLGQTDTSPVEARHFLGSPAIIGQSTHSQKQAKSAPFEVLDYIACGPVFHSQTKSGHSPEIGLSGVAAIKSVSPLPLVAIGGITLKTADSVLESGADSVAMIRELREAKEHLQAYLL